MDDVLTTATPASDYPLLAEYHRAFYEQRKSYLDASLDAYRSFDKTMTTLSAGALSLSIAFVTQLVLCPRGDPLALACIMGPIRHGPLPDPGLVLHQPICLAACHGAGG